MSQGLELQTITTSEQRGRTMGDRRALLAVANAARDSSRVSGLTHDFYRYPARFSPTFAGQAIELFSQPDDLVLDPYMGGGTVVVEAARLGRDVVGNDINALSHFLATVKTSPLSTTEHGAVARWAIDVIPTLRANVDCPQVDELLESERTRNLSVPRARYLKRLIATALTSITALPGERAQNFARCAILNAAQGVLDGRRCNTTTSKFRDRLQADVHRMLQGVRDYEDAIADVRAADIFLANADAARLADLPIFASGRRARLVVTSPPYPGVHVLYHRWQIDGRRESPAPYWIANRPDGQGASYYAFSSRDNVDGYFASALRTLQGTRAVMETGGIIVQLIAFNNPRTQLRRYLDTMIDAGFEEVRWRRNRVWRGVPNRKWHATVQGHTSSAREVLLVHEAV